MSIFGPDMIQDAVDKPPLTEEARSIEIAASIATINFLLVDKGICTQAEFDQVRSRFVSEMDRAAKEISEKRMAKMRAENPGFAMMMDLLDGKPVGQAMKDSAEVSAREKT